MTYHHYCSQVKVVLKDTHLLVIHIGYFNRRQIRKEKYTMEVYFSHVQLVDGLENEEKKIIVLLQEITHELFFVLVPSSGGLLESMYS